jgi:hypothetical protein
MSVALGRKKQVPRVARDDNFLPRVFLLDWK